MDSVVETVNKQEDLSDDIEKDPRNQNNQSKKKKGRGGKKKRSKNDDLKVSPDAVELWLGDIPKEICRERNCVERMLNKVCSESSEQVPVPFVRDVSRKTYRHGEGKELYGFAFLLCRNKKEADEFTKFVNGVEIAPGFIPRIQASESKSLQHHIVNEKEFLENCPIDPPIIKQINPLKRAALEQRVSNFTTIYDAQMELENLYKTAPRRVEEHVGVEIPSELCENATKCLDSLVWPAVSDRSKVTATNYLVLQRFNTKDKVYSELMENIETMLKWADPNYNCTHIAITRNFLGSPHIDFPDKSFQFAVGLGNYEGGQLVVEDSNDHTLLHAVDTRNKIAKVDGRFVHWVRKFTGGPRYSLIFYTTDESAYTEPTESCFTDFQPLIK